MNKKVKNNDKGISTIDYIISVSIIVISAYLFATVILKKYLNIGFLVSTDNLNFILLSFAEIIVPVIIGLLYLYVKNFNYINNQIKKTFRNIQWKVIFWGYLLVIGLGILYSIITQYLGFTSSKTIFDSFSETKNITILLIFTLLGVLAAIYEEIIFRGVLFDLFKRFFIKIFGGKNKEPENKITIPVILTIIITALLFGFMHLQYDMVLIIQIIIIGIVFGLIRYRFGLINTIFIHVINNFIIIFGTMLLPVIVSNTVFYKNIRVGDTSATKLKNNFNKEKNLFLEEIIKQQIKDNKGIKDNKIVQKFMEENEEDFYNPYIYKYFFLPEGKFNGCLKNISKIEKTNCIRDLKKLYDKFKEYKKLYEFGLIDKYNNKQIDHFLDFIDRTFFSIEKLKKLKEERLKEKVKDK